MNNTDSLWLHLGELFNNSVLAWGLASCGFAQLMKLFFELILQKKWRPSILFETGGMPSSHSALVTGTAAGVGWELGFDHPAFALAATIAFIVMYDASGIRRNAGLIASRVNLLPSSSWPDIPKESLKENLGHTKLEVVIGSMIGPTIALPGIAFIGSPVDLAHLIGLNLFLN